MPDTPVTVRADHYYYEGEGEWNSPTPPVNPSSPRDHSRALFSSHEGTFGENFGWLRFQCGGVLDFGRNGVTIEEVTEVILHRLHELHDKFPCEENEQALYHYNHALHFLNRRTAKRQAQGVEGKEVAHV